MVTEPQGEQEHGSKLMQVPLSWQGLEDLPVLAVNQFVVQIDSPDGSPEQILVAVGHAAPPVVLGSAEEQQAAIAGLDMVPVKPLARFSLSRNRVAALVRVLDDVAQTFDAAKAEGER